MVDPNSKALRKPDLAGIHVLSWLGIPVRSQVYMAFGLWVTQYALWTVLGREMSEPGPVLKPMLFLWLRNIFSVAVPVPLAIRQAGGLRAFLPALKDVPLVLLLGSTIWGNQFFYIYVRPACRERDALALSAPLLARVSTDALFAGPYSHTCISMTLPSVTSRDCVSRQQRTQRSWRRAFLCTPQ